MSFANLPSFGEPLRRKCRSDRVLTAACYDRTKLAELADAGFGAWQKLKMDQLQRSVARYNHVTFSILTFVI